jgi:hypothetical protein
MAEGFQQGRLAITPLKPAPAAPGDTPHGAVSQP